MCETFGTFDKDSENSEDEFDLVEGNDYESTTEE